jgi:monovalent cation:H+ antiporter-2, CPA2 family
LIVISMRYSFSVALSIAFALAQIGEFSFILAEQAGHYSFFPDEAFDIIVACALISISVNPLLFTLLNYLNPYLAKQDSLDMQHVQGISKQQPKALIVGFGTIGQNLILNLEKIGYQPVIIEKDVDTVVKLVEEQREAVYGEASFPNLLKMAHIEAVNVLIITILDLTETLNIIHHAHETYPNIPIIARAQNLEEKSILNNMGIHVVCEDEEISIALNRMLENVLK